MDRPLPWLRYVNADDVEGIDLDWQGLKVRDTAGEELGTVDGFVVDVDNGRPYYVVVDSAGWFKSRDFLLPVGRARMDSSLDAIVADVPKERINRFPGFDKDRFERLSTEELRDMGNQIVGACAVNPSTHVAVANVWEAPDYREPTWWRFDRSRQADAVASHEDDASPHLGGRAQPGDVIGIETGGESTHIGETSEDENKRRRDAQQAIKPSRNA